MTERSGNAMPRSRAGGDAFFERCLAEFKAYDAKRTRLLARMAVIRAQVAGDSERRPAPQPWCGSTGAAESVKPGIGAVVAAFLERAEREDEALARRGYFELQAEANHALECAGNVANRIFAVAAESPEGILVKLAILRQALGRRGAQEDGDEDLEAFQDVAPVLWLDSLEADIARLVGRESSPIPCACNALARVAAKD